MSNQNLIHILTISLRKALVVFFLFFSPYLKAQQFTVNQQSDDQLLNLGSDCYNKNQYAAAAVYFYAYLQRKPSQLSDQAFKKKLYSALDYSLQQAVAKQGLAGVDDKADGGTHAVYTQKPNLPAKTAAVSTIKIQSVGYWTCNDGGTYYIHQVGNDVWWYEQSPGANNSNRFANVMHGRIDATTNKIVGQWADVPSGSSANSGQITLQIINSKKIKILSQTGGFSGAEWNAFSPVIKNEVSKASKPNIKKAQ